jgi:hypothetical protein
MSVNDLGVVMHIYNSSYAGDVNGRINVQGGLNKKQEILHSK